MRSLDAAAHRRDAATPAALRSDINPVPLNNQRIPQQAASPSLTGATALQTNILAWQTPVAIILVMILGGMAMANRISWGWCIGAILGDRHCIRRTAHRRLG